MEYEVLWMRGEPANRIIETQLNYNLQEPLLFPQPPLQVFTTIKLRFTMSNKRAWEGNGDSYVSKKLKRSALLY